MSLNKDIKSLVKYLYALKNHLPDGHKRNFNTKPPNTIRSAARMFNLIRVSADEEGVSSSRQIMQDYARNIWVAEVVYMNNGEIIPVPENRNGGWYDK